MKKNILIIAYAYPPNNVAGAQRPYALAKYLDKAKYNVKVITCKNPDLPMGKNPDFDQHIEGVELIEVKSKIGDSASKLRQNNPIKTNVKISSKLKSFLFKTAQRLIFPDKGMFWYPEVKSFLKKNNELVKNTDVIFSTSPGVTNHRIASFIKKQNSKAKWIADFRDFNYVEHWEFKSGIKAILHKKLEASIIRKADEVTFVTQTMQKAYQKFYPKHDQKMHCVYNGFDKSDFPEMVQQLRDTEKLSFFYAGSFYNGLRSPFPLMQLVDKAIQDKLLSKEDVQIRIAGNIEDEIKQQIGKFESNQCLNFLGSIPRTEVIKQMSEVTFLWLIVANIKAHYQTIPIKIFEYIAARKPIVNFAPATAESSQIIEANNLGFNFDTLEFNLEEAYVDFKRLVSDFKNGYYSKPLPVENLDSFVWDNQIKLIENLF